MQTCENCLHGKDCWLDEETGGRACYLFLDKSRYIETPCKPGDTVWILVDGINVPLESRVRTMLIGNNTMGFDCSVKGYLPATKSYDEFGKTLFLTREEAEEVLKKKKEDKTNGRTELE